MEGKKRSLAIDMVKGLSILTLFFLHFENGFFTFHHNYFVVRSPAFFIVIGWLWGMSSNNRTIPQHWQKRKKGLVMPYVWLSLVFLVFDAIMVACHLIDPQILWRDIYKTVCLKGIGTLWFLPALLGGEMLFLKVRDMKPGWRAASIFISLILIYSFTLWGDFSFIDNPNHRHIIKAPFDVVRDSCQAFIYIALAFYTARKYGRQVMGQSRPALFLEGLGLLLVAFLALNFPHVRGVAAMLLFIFRSAMAGFGILFLFTAIETFGVVSKPLAYFGKNSLIVMAFHFCFLFQIALVFDKVVMGHDEYSGGITLVYFAIAVVAQVILIEIINRRFKFLIGK